MRPFFFLLSAAMLSACNADIRIGNGFATEERQIFDFESGPQGWIAGFSDYDVNNAAIFNLQSGVTALPNDTSRKGFRLAGNNASDDLFMFITSRFRGLRVSTRYTADVVVELISNAGANCAGIGGAPGESVYVKFGFAEQQPMQEGYFLNVDKGNQSNGGAQASVIGNVAIANLDCSGVSFGRKTVQTTLQSRLEFTTTSDGRIWLFLGTDSGFEGRTDIYFDSIDIRVRPL